ncbi:MAG TPA: MBOAT family O-acyltransferase [Bacteroidia bacterium]|nr:MBOAT family O-acyltransferase [Bacteroidia bacterium]
MLFNSFQFFLFFPVVTFLYFLLPHKLRWLHLLIASCIFYMAFIPVYILILLFTIIIDYVAGILIENAEGARRKYFLVMSIVANVGVLSVFKYYNFFADNINSLLNLLHISSQPVPFLNIILPLGLSFHTFQAMSYTIEVYRDNQKAEKHFGIYALYVMFYPQLVAGPIERPQNLLHQFREKHYFEASRVSEGLKLMLWGMFKKVVIADRIAVLTGPVFNNPHNYPAITLFMAVIMFSFQIFCDFSGYSDIAIGSAKVMGFTLMKNFDWPYKARSISEFWKRWHISLSTWFRDYLYISLGGNRVSIPRWYFNLFIVFLISGFWHGANWTFVAWGALHGFYLILAIITQGIRDSAVTKIGISKTSALGGFLQVAFTFSLVALGWIFFRANNVFDAWYIIKKLPLVFGDIQVSLQSHKIAFWNIWSISGITSIKYVIEVMALIFMIELMHISAVRLMILSTFKKITFFGRFTVCYFMLLIILLSFIDRPPASFIYFQF